MLALQVAAGIILAYIVIANQRKLLSIGKALIALIALLALIAAIVWVANLAWAWAGDHLSRRFFSKLFDLISIIPIFALFATGLIGMLMLVGLVLTKRPETALHWIGRLFDTTETKKDNIGCAAIIGLGMVMVLINYGLSYPLWALTPAGEWYEAIDKWSRSHSWADGGSVLFGALLWQWVWIPLGAYFLAKRLWP